MWNHRNIVFKRWGETEAQRGEAARLVPPSPVVLLAVTAELSQVPAFAQTPTMNFRLQQKGPHCPPGSPGQGLVPSSPPKGVKGQLGATGELTAA